MEGVSEGRVYLKLAKTGDAGYHIPKKFSLSTQKIRPFKVLEKVGALTYRLKLPKNMKIHPVISVRHLEQAQPDPYQREIPPPEGVVIESQRHYVVEKIVRRERRDDLDGYIVKWRGYQERT